MMLLSIFLHILSLVLTFLLNIVPNMAALVSSQCTFMMKECKISFKLANFLVASGLLTIIMCIFYSVFMYTRFEGPKKSHNSFRNNTNQTQPVNRAAQQEYPEHNNPFESTYRTKSLNYRTF